MLNDSLLDVIILLMIFLAGALLLGSVLFAWQFPHFNSLSWNLRPDYSRAGYRMMSVIQPRRCQLVALRYSVALTSLCVLAPALDVTTTAFIPLSLAPNLYLTYLAYEFYKKGDSSSSRRLFFCTLWHIPLLMLFMIFTKKGFAPELFMTSEPSVISLDRNKAIALGQASK